MPAISHPPDSRTPRPAFLVRFGFLAGRKLETWVALSLTAVILCFQVARLTHAGALWRDEAGAVQLATLPTFKDVVSSLPHEAFPLLFSVILRSYSTVTGGSDIAWRIFGFLVGISIVGALWWNMWVVRRGPPLLSLALLGFNAAFVQWPDTIRGYGLGIFLILMAMGFLWRMVEQPSPARIATATASAIISVQCLFHNAVLILAICLGGTAVALARGKEQPRPLTKSKKGVAADVVGANFPGKRVRRLTSAATPTDLSDYTVVIVWAIALVSVLSLLPYSGLLSRAREWDMIVRLPVSVEHLSNKLGEALSASGWWMPGLWGLLYVVGLGACLVAAFWPSTAQFGDEQRAIMLFCWPVLLAGAFGYLDFLMILSYFTEPWYYLALMGVVALLLDFVFDSFPKPFGRNVRIVGALIIALTSFLPTWRAAQVRQTNTDLVAAKLGQVAAKEDLIVVVPWYYGISFERYYHGAAAWMTVPPIEFHKFHRYDLFKAQMVLPDPNAPIEPVQDRIRDTLKNGHRVWLAGASRLVQPGETLQTLSPAPDPKWGWQNEVYSSVWAAKVAAYLQFSSLRTEEISLPFTGPVNKFENMPLRMFDGWAAP